MVRKVNVVPHNPNWAAQFQSEADRIRAALNSEIINIHHIGSTAIPGISAKPVLDLLIEVISLERIDQFDEVMIGLGYKPKGEFGLPRRRFFTKNN
ncbi:MAG: GrpB family protein, partial [Anaerolineae bacterium]|nr:GrpB family protein [Anaerolineae bacterium]